MSRKAKYVTIVEESVEGLYEIFSEHPGPNFDAATFDIEDSVMDLGFGPSGYTPSKRIEGISRSLARKLWNEKWGIK